MKVKTNLAGWIQRAEKELKKDYRLKIACGQKDVVNGINDILRVAPMYRGKTILSKNLH